VFPATSVSVAVCRKSVAPLAIARKLLTRAWHLLADMQATDVGTPLRRP
jgi:hypothetical protein